MRVIIILLILAVAACSSGHELPGATGPVFQLNAGKWTATDPDFATAREIAQ